MKNLEDHARRERPPLPKAVLYAIFGFALFVLIGIVCVINWDKIF